MTPLVIDGGLLLDQPLLQRRLDERGARQPAVHRGSTALPSDRR